MNYLFAKFGIPCCEIASIFQSHQLFKPNKMWIILILIAGIVIYFWFSSNGTKGSNSNQKRSSPKLNSQELTFKKPNSDWVFQREIDQKGVPEILNTYRKLVNGYDYKKIVRSLKGIAKIENEVKRNLGYLPFLEPMSEIEKMGCFEFNPDMPGMDLENFMFELINFFNAYYPAIGAKGQMKDLENILRHIPEYNGWAENLAFGEFELREKLINSIRGNGHIFKKDLDDIEGFKDYSLGRNLIYRLIQYNIIEEGKAGKYITYKLKMPD